MTDPIRVYTAHVDGCDGWHFVGVARSLDAATNLCLKDVSVDGEEVIYGALTHPSEKEWKYTVKIKANPAVYVGGTNTIKFDIDAHDI